MADSIDSFINGILDAQSSNPLTTTNQNEYDGNVNDLIFRTDQAAQALTVTGGTTLTAISPQNFINDLGKGKISLAVIVWLAIIGFFGWYVMKK